MSDVDDNKKGAWTPEEDDKLKHLIHVSISGSVSNAWQTAHGHMQTRKTILAS